MVPRAGPTEGRVAGLTRRCSAFSTAARARRSTRTGKKEAGSTGPGSCVFAATIGHRARPQGCEKRKMALALEAHRAEAQGGPLGLRRHRRRGRRSLLATTVYRGTTRATAVVPTVAAAAASSNLNSAAAAGLVPAAAVVAMQQAMAAAEATAAKAAVAATVAAA